MYYFALQVPVATVENLFVKSFKQARLDPIKDVAIIWCDVPKIPIDTRTSYLLKL